MWQREEAGANSYAVTPLVPVERHARPLPSVYSQPPAVLEGHDKQHNTASLRVLSASEGEHASHEGTMLFGDLAKHKASVSHRRRVMAATSAFTAYEADMTSRDRAKAKEAVRRYLAENVAQDWMGLWDEHGVAQLGNEHKHVVDWRERDEWASNASEPEDTSVQAVSPEPNNHGMAPTQTYDCPDSITMMLETRTREKKMRRKGRLLQEMQTNDGLRCWVNRRDAWTGARVIRVPGSSSHIDSAVRLQPYSDTTLLEPVTSASASAPRNRKIQPASKAGSNAPAGTYPEVDTEIPIAGPLLPSNNLIRENITPAAYNSIYDKIVVQGMAPSVPINLKDLVRSCVQGWQKDGEWPPRDTPSEPIIAVRRTVKSRGIIVAGLLGRAPARAEGLVEGDGSGGGGGKGIRKGLQKVLGLDRRRDSEGF